jgi:hypothetical protein
MLIYMIPTFLVGGAVYIGKDFVLAQFQIITRPAIVI